MLLLVDLFLLEQDILKTKWNKKALEDDNNFIAEQDKIETSEASETPANQ